MFLRILFYLILLVGSSLGEGQVWSQTPRLVPETIEMGDVGEGVHHAEAILQNETQLPLLVTDVRGSCSCLVTGEYPVTVDAGKKHLLKFSFDGGGKMGHFGGKLVALCEQGGSPIPLVLKFSANVLVMKKAIATPKSVFSSLSEPEQSFKRSIAIGLVRVEKGGGNDIVIDASDWMVVNFDMPSAKYSSTAADTEGLFNENFAFEVNAGIPELTGVQYGEITVSSKTQRFEPIVVPVVINATGPLVSTPKSIISIGKRNQQEIIVSIWRRGDKTKKVEVQKYSLEGIPENALDLKIAGNSEISVFRTLKKIDKPLNGSLFVLADVNGKSSSIRIPIYISEP